ncbi:MAG: 50S ribosomal protein L21 [Bdellovibrionota bacterium]
MYAIIETGGKQYRVSPGDVVSLESLNGEIGKTVTFDKVLLVGGKTGDQALVGTPYVAQATLEAEIVQQARGEKLLTIKYRRRKGYRRTIGHRQELTRVLVTKISNGQGQSEQFDAAKRNEALLKASVPFATKKPKQAKPKLAKATASAEGAEAATTPTKKRSSTTTAKKAAPKKTKA